MEVVESEDSNDVQVTFWEPSKKSNAAAAEGKGVDQRCVPTVYFVALYMMFCLCSLSECLVSQSGGLLTSAKPIPHDLFANANVLSARFVSSFVLLLFYVLMMYAVHCA